jgi:anti-sigma factor RsiW
MHQKIRHHLEACLRGEDQLEPSDSGLRAEVRAHLGECAECAGEFRLLEEQSRLLRSLRSEPSGGESLEPRAGFYARVIERIEGRMEAQRASFWAPFLERKFGFRLAVASAALVALLGAYLITTEPSGPELFSSPAVVRTAAAPEAGIPGPAEEVRQSEQRDAVLVDLASFRQ